jgi:hypothetical protein
MFDILMCFVFPALIPLLLLRPAFLQKVLGAWLDCLTGKRTWVGYDNSVSVEHLPKLRKGVFTVSSGVKAKLKEGAMIKSLNQLYASNYNVGMDLEALLKTFMT